MRPLRHKVARPSNDWRCSASKVGVGRVSKLNFSLRENGASSSNQRWMCARLAEPLPGSASADGGVGGGACACANAEGPNSAANPPMSDLARPERLMA